MDTHAHGQDGDRQPLLRGVRGKRHADFPPRDRDYLRAALVGACALLAALAVLIFKQAADVRDLNARLSAVYQKAFYETCELMEGMSTNLRKLLVTGSAQQEQVLLSEIARQAQGAQDDLSQLPLGEEAVSATIKFVNQAGDFATSLAGRLAAARPSATRTMRPSPRSRIGGRALRAPGAAAFAL